MAGVCLVPALGNVPADVVASALVVVLVQASVRVVLPGAAFELSPEV
jgi:hypothetical protein